ncbi:MAG: 16S rRNA (adenine(1518)-N(6)/adenine(1519)-N(6))-dimethyltransferase RsmA [Chitinophagaceae bacterium]
MMFLFQGWYTCIFVGMYTLKKSLGQHFLKDEEICRQVVRALQQQPFAQLLEVGPGGGALTKYLLPLQQVDFKCVEVDDEKVQFLLQTYPVIKDKIIHKSFLDMDAPFEGMFTVVGNFPYNISSQIVFKILEWKTQVECMIGMFQKEVAQRIVAKEGSKIYGVTSVLVQAFFDTDYLFEVAETAFTPPPKVKSAVIQLRPVKTALAMKSEKHLFLLVKTAFNQRRKTLRNGVRGLFEPDVLEDAVFDKRAEQLSVEAFAALTFRMR